MTFLRTLSLSCVLAGSSLLPGQSGTSAGPVEAAKSQPAYLTDPKFIEAMKEGKDLEHKRQYSFALDDYKKASKIAGGSCRDCLQKMNQIQVGGLSYKDAIATAEQLKALATDALSRSIAEAYIGNALLAQGGEKPKPPQLDAAHAAFQAALADYPKNLNAQYHDACVLARMGKNDDARKEFAACSDQASATDPMKVRARHFAEEPALSLSKMAPAFEVTALDGSRFNLDNMGGKVVLIDFWATWCGPCNAELPHMKKIAREFANDPLAIISISWDSDEQKWKDFIAKNEMTWIQYRDKDHSLSQRFGINAIPHYFTIDSDGVLTAEMLGSGSDVEGKLKKLIKRAKEAEANRTVEKAENKLP